MRTTRIPTDGKPAVMAAMVPAYIPSSIIFVIASAILTVQMTEYVDLTLILVESLEPLLGTCKNLTVTV